MELELSRGRARIRCATDRAYCERIVVRDRAGRTIAEDRRGRMSGAVGRLRGREEPLVVSLRDQLDLFAARVRGEDGGALADAEDGVVAMAVVEAARRSEQLGGAEVTVETSAFAALGGPS
jgi:predicted dehydrogenase